MAPKNFVACDREPEPRLPPSLREWLAEDPLAWFVIDAVEQFVLGAIYGVCRTDGGGRAAFEPQMMVALLNHHVSRIRHGPGVRLASRSRAA